jgi:phosphate uptake regulator
MEIRKVQRTGDMHYVYMPTNWCKKHQITSKSQVNLKESPSGALIISPTETKAILKDLNINLDEEDQDIINKLIIACYLNPLGSFKINLKKELTAKKLLNQKNIISLESVEIDKKTISCDSTVMLSEPGLLLKTMVKKIKNLSVVLVQNYNIDLINRYEEEIDRSKMLIQKSIINYMTMTVPVNLKMIDLYYISLITVDLERMVDYMIQLKKTDKDFLEKISGVIDLLKKMMESLDTKSKITKFTHINAIEFVKTVKILGEPSNKEENYSKRRIADLMSNISEIILDWSITNQID